MQELQRIGFKERRKKNLKQLKMRWDFLRWLYKEYVIGHIRIYNYKSSILEYVRRISNERTS